MAQNSNSIYEIFASLGLDASSLDEGLKQAKVDLDAILPDIKSVQDAVLQLDKAFGQSAIGLQVETAALAAFEAKTKTTGQQVYALHSALLALKSAGPISSTQGPYAETIGKSRESALVSTGNEDFLGQFSAKAALHEKEKALSQSLERQRLIEEQQKVFNNARLAEEERSWQVYIRQLKTNHDRVLDEQAQFRERSNLEFERSRLAPTGAFGVSGGDSASATSVRGQALAQAVGVSVPRGLMNVVSSLGPVKSAIASAFSGLVVLAFVDILAQVGSKLYALGEDFAGFGAKAKEAWANAEKGSMAAVVQLDNYIASQGKIWDKVGSNKPLPTKLEELNARMDEIRKNIRGSIGAREEIMKTLQGMGLEADPIGAAAESKMTRMYETVSSLILNNQLSTKAITEGGAIDALREEYNMLTKSIYDQTESLKVLDAQKDRNMAKEETASRRMRQLRDRVHEEPYRLPWYLGAQPSESFLRSLEGAPARRGNFLPGPPSLRRENLSDSPEGKNPLGGPRAQVILENHFSPIIRVDGESTAQIVREKIIPAIHNDYSNNQRESMDKLVGLLKAAGVQVG